MIFSILLLCFNNCRCLMIQMKTVYTWVSLFFNSQHLWHVFYWFIPCYCHAFLYTKNNLITLVAFCIFHYAAFELVKQGWAFSVPLSIMCLFIWKVRELLSYVVNSKEVLWSVCGCVMCVRPIAQWWRFPRTSLSRRSSVATTSETLSLALNTVSTLVVRPHSKTCEFHRNGVRNVFDCFSMKIKQTYISLGLWLWW